MKIFELNSEKEKNLAAWLGSVAMCEDSPALVDAALKVAVADLLAWIRADEESRMAFDMNDEGDQFPSKEAPGKDAAAAAARHRAKLACRMFYRALPPAWVLETLAGGMNHRRGAVNDFI